MKNVLIISALLMLCLFTSCLKVQVYVRSYSPAYQRAKLNNDLYYYYTRQHDSAHCVVVLVGGSGHSSSLYTLARFAPLMRSLHADIYMLQKRHLRHRETGMGQPSKAFIKDYYFTQMAADQQLMIEKVAAANKDKKLVLLGVSEGATIAAKLSSMPQVKYLVMIGGGGMLQADELKTLYPTQRHKLDQLYDEIKANAQSTDRQAMGYTYKYWGDILFRNPMTYLTPLSLPVVTGNGADDKSTPVQSVQLVDSTFKALKKTNLQCIIYPHCDHTLKDEKGHDHLREFFEQCNKVITQR